MEIYVNYLAIEVTRRCNMKCEHCLRGDAQNLDISTAVLSGIAKHIHPASVIFTGGEPSLNVPAIKRYFELAERYDTMPAAFYVATNGATSKEQMRDLALTLLESYAKMEEQDMCEVDVSVDMFHEAFRDNDNAKILSGLSFFDLLTVTAMLSSVSLPIGSRRLCSIALVHARTQTVRIRCTIM